MFKADNNDRRHWPRSSIFVINFTRYSGVFIAYFELVNRDWVQYYKDWNQSILYCKKNVNEET